MFFRGWLTGGVPLARGSIYSSLRLHATNPGKRQGQYRLRERAYRLRNADCGIKKEFFHQSAIRIPQSYLAPLDQFDDADAARGNGEPDNVLTAITYDIYRLLIHPIARLLNTLSA